jgi:hypothetical protein
VLKLALYFYQGPHSKVWEHWYGRSWEISQDLAKWHQYNCLLFPLSHLYSITLLFFYEFLCFFLSLRIRWSS